MSAYARPVASVYTYVYADVHNPSLTHIPEHGMVLTTLLTFLVCGSWAEPHTLSFLLVCTWTHEQTDKRFTQRHWDGVNLDSTRRTALRLIIYYTRRDGNVPCYHRAQEPEGKLVRRLHAPTIWKIAPCWHDPKPADQALGTIPILGDADLFQVHPPKGQLEAAAFKLLHRQPSKPFFRYIHKNHVSLSSILLYHCVTT